MKKLVVYQMNKEEYERTLFAKKIDKDELWDYPLDEVDHIINDTDIEEVALIGDRLYEL